MKIEMLRAKLHRATVTHADINYVGSLGIDVELMEAVGLYPYEKILVANMDNGNRFETYAIAEPFGSRRFVLNGAAARLGSAGDRIIIMSFCWVDEAIVHEGRYRPKVLRLDDYNEPVPVSVSYGLAEDSATMLSG